MLNNIYKFALISLLIGVLLKATPIKANADQVTDKLDALSAKIDSLQSNVLSKLEQLEASVKSSSGADTETAARNSFSEIQNLVSSNQIDLAKNKITEFQTKYAGTQYAESMSRLKNEVDVFGKPVPTKWNIEKWYQFEKEIDLSSDKPTFVIFWEIWCPHCRKEIPKIVELQKTFTAKGVQFIGLTKLSRGTKEEELNTFLKENKVSYPIAKEAGDLSTYFAVTGVPAGVFIKNKKVLWRGHPALVTAEKIEEWIK